MADISNARLQALVAQLSTAEESPFPADLSVLDHLIFGLVQENLPVSAGYAVYKNLMASFHNYNELRVSHPRELVNLLEGVPNAEVKAKSLLEVLQFVFETTYAFDLESMRKKPARQAQKQLSKLAGATTFAVDATIRRALDASAIPLDESALRVLAQLGIVPANANSDEIRTQLEANIPLHLQSRFSNFVSELAGNHAEVERVSNELNSIKTSAKISRLDETETPVDPTQSQGSKKKPVAKKAKT